MDWTILGIAPTDDKKAITAAYRAKLKTTNPEDKPEEFKALRAAYEEALRLADQVKTEPAQDMTPVGRWAAQVETIYNDYPSRINVQLWNDLLSDDVCAGLDTRPQAEDALLRFLMEHYYVPRPVWQALDAVFGWLERAEELCEQYPRDFIEQCVLNGIRFDQSLSFDQYEPGLDGVACDAYRRLYYQCAHTPPEQRGELLDQLEAMPEQHAHGRAMRCHWLMTVGRGEECRAGYRELTARWPNDITLNIDYAVLLTQSDSPDEAEPIIRRMLELVPDHIYARRALAECQAAKGDLSDAKETLYDVMHISGDDPIIMEQLAARLREWNNTLIGQYREALEKDPTDAESGIDLGWCYLQNEEPDAAMEVALKIDPAKADPFDYHNLMGKLYLHIEMFAEAGEHIEKVVSIVRSLTPDGTDKTDKRIRRLPEMLQVWGSCLMQTGHNDRAREIYREALSLAPDDPKVLNLMGNIHYAAGEYEQCLEINRHLTEVSPGSWFSHLMQALCLYKLRRDREAFDAVGRAQSLQGGDLSLYVLKMQILLRNGAYDEVRGILEFLKEAGAPEDISTDFVRAQLLELADHDTDAAFRSYQAIARQVEEGETLLDTPALYHRMAYLMGKKMDMGKKEDRDILLDVLEKGLSHDKYDEDCLSYKAWLLKRSGKLDEAIKMYRSLATPNAKRALADLYYSDLDSYAAEALAAYEELMQTRQTPELCFYAATCCHRMGDDAKSEHYYRLELELDPDDIDAWAGLAFIREHQGNLTEALEYITRATDLMWQTEVFYDWLLEHQLKVLRRMGRHAEALDLVDKAMERADYPGGFQTKFDICTQFGLWAQAEAVLDQWQSARRGDPEQTKATGRLHLLRGKMLKATFAYGKVKHNMTPDEEIDLRLQLADLEANSKRQIQLWNQKLDTAHEKSYVLMNLALAVFWNGDREGAKKIAAKGLELVDEILATYQIDEALYRTRRSALLALVGRIDEARAELDAVRKLPLCEHCAYGKCKDADIYEAYIEEIAGNRDRAKQLFLAGQQNWPDELDFHSGETRLKKKKGK